MKLWVLTTDISYVAPELVNEVEINCMSSYIAMPKLTTTNVLLVETCDTHEMYVFVY